jgi:hypothetical protein
MLAARLPAGWHCVREPDHPMLDTVTEAQWREFDANGVVSLGVALSPTELRALSDRLDAIMLGEVGDPFERMLMQLEGGGQTRGHKGATLDYRKIQGLEHDPVIFDYLQSELFRCVAERTCECGICSRASVATACTAWQSLALATVHSD